MGNNDCRHRSARRLQTLHGRLLRPDPNQEIASVSIAEFMFWACALDERLFTTDPAYAARRDADERGQVLPALRFVRDRHTHQVAITTSLEFIFERSSDPNVSPDLLRVKNRW